MDNFTEYLKHMGWKPEQGQFISPYDGALLSMQEALAVQGINRPLSHKLVDDAAVKLAQEALWPLMLPRTP